MTYIVYYSIEEKYSENEVTTVATKKRRGWLTLFEAATASTGYQPKAKAGGWLASLLPESVFLRLSVPCQLKALKRSADSLLSGWPAGLGDTGG